MPRVFEYAFDPPNEDPVGTPTVQLTVAEIEAAGLKEILQTPGGGLSSWEILDALLAPTGPLSPFTFREPIGQAREVKVAMSGLFGRFVARAYLERYFDLSIFVHLGNKSITLDGRLALEIKRLSRGDLPDWVACKGDLNQLIITEAKGCHDKPGPNLALQRAYQQTKRVDILASKKKMKVKRIAVATRWATQVSPPTTPMLFVRDPEDPGDSATEEVLPAVCLALARLHTARLIGRLGYPELANTLSALSHVRTEEEYSRATTNARNAFEKVSTAPSSMSASAAAGSELIGAIVTRAGPLLTAAVSTMDERTLQRLGLRPKFVGIEREIVKALVEGDADLLRTRSKRKRVKDADAIPDQSGTWVVNLGSHTEI